MATGTGSGRTPATAGTTSREIGRQGALFVSLGAVIGSGWLFASFAASELTGGSAVVAWLVAGLLTLFLALNYAELGAAFPVDGGIGRFPLFAFGRAMGFSSGWLSWMTAVCIPPIETVASLRYASNYLPWLNSEHGTTTHLTPAGLVVAATLLAGFTLLNVAGIRWFRETNSVLVMCKIALPIIVAVVLLQHAFHVSNFRADGGFFAFGTSGVVRAISAGGIAFSLVGFEQAVQLGGETREPQRSIPYALLGSVLLATFIYFLLQVAFTAALPPEALAHGWAHLSFPDDYGPLAGLSKAVGVGWLAYVIYVAASVSPAGTSLTYTATSSRIPYSMALEGYLPSPFARLSARRVPLLSIVVCYCVELLLLIVLRNGERLLIFATAALALVYALAPVSLHVLRRTAPEVPRPYLMTHYQVLARVGFVVANLILYWCGWNTNRIVLIGLAIGVVIEIGLAVAHPNYRHAAHEWRALTWLVPYLIGLALISAFGRYDGGAAVIPRYWDVVIVTAFSLLVFQVATAIGQTIHARMPEGERPIDHWTRESNRRGDAGTAAPEGDGGGPPDLS